MSYMIAATRDTAPRLVSYFGPARDVIQWPRDPKQARTYATKREAFAAAMTLDASRMIPRGASVEVVRALP